MIKRRRMHDTRFTLLELLLVMALIAMVVTSSKWALENLLHHHAFVQEANQLREVIAFTQEMMMDTRGDYTLVLHHQEGAGLSLKIDSPQALPPKLTAMIEKNICRKVAKLSFNGVYVQELLLHFEGHLGRISAGEILLEGQKGQQERILLHGFPGRLR